MTTTTTTEDPSCDIHPELDWRDFGWCCATCALAAHLEWHKERGTVHVYRDGMES